MSDNEEENVTRNGRKAADTRRELFQCGVWTFPWLTVVSLCQLTVYLNKLYQDCSAVSVYYDRGKVYYCIISVFCLLVPPLVYMMYLVSVHIKREDGIKRSEVGTKIVEGLFLIPWQIKSIVEVLHFSVQRVCKRRPPSEDEKTEHSLIDRKAKVLEFFEDFFAGFIQLILQTYLLFTYYSQMAKVQHRKNLSRKDEPYNNALYGEIVASGLTLISMLMAVRRKDDGPLTFLLSILGWASIMGSRAFTIALAASVIHFGIIGFCLLHAIIVTLWLTPICWKTYSETQLSRQRKCATTLLVFFLFGLPSLIYWPILFHLKAKKRPIIFMVIISVENIGLFCIWYFMKEHSYWDSNSTMCIAVVAGGTCVGCLFILIYVGLKPKYVDQVVLHDMRYEDTHSFGMYYDLCEVTFQLHVSKFVDTNLKKIRETNR